MAMRENVRSGRRANFYITENSFIDYYARELDPVAVAVYHTLERHVNCETRSTWVGTARMAELLNISQRTVQRSLKSLEELKLIRIIRNSTITTYVVVPVPPPLKTAAIPLFDSIPNELLNIGDTYVATATATPSETTPVSRTTTTVSQLDDIHDAAYKEEQHLLNNTCKQDKENDPKLREMAVRVITILGLPATDNNLKMVQAALVADKAYTGRSLQEVAERITRIAIEDREKGITINKFYFEDAKWRQDKRLSTRYGTNKAEQRKLDNLKANAQAKQWFKERFHNS